MSSTLFDKDTLVDLTVNFIPLAILGFFFVGFVFVNPWGESGISLIRVIQFLIIGLTFVGLVHITYVSAKRIEGDDEPAEEYENETN